MRKLTSFTKLTTGEGARIAFTFSEVDDNGKLISRNNKGCFIAMDDGILGHIRAIEQFISNNHLEG